MPSRPTPAAPVQADAWPSHMRDETLVQAQLEEYEERRKKQRAANNKVWREEENVPVPPASTWAPLGENEPIPVPQH